MMPNPGACFLGGGKFCGYKKDFYIVSVMIKS